MASTTIEAGNTLLARDLKPRTVIHRGQIADGLLQDGALNIMMKVEVLEDCFVNPPKPSIPRCPLEA